MLTMRHRKELGKRSYIKNSIDKCANSKIKIIKNSHKSKSRDRHKSRIIKNKNLTRLNQLKMNV
jgi:hypothetical protein